MIRVRTNQFRCVAMLCIGVVPLSAQQQRYGTNHVVMAAALTLYDSSQTVLGRLGVGMHLSLSI